LQLAVQPADDIYRLRVALQLGLDAHRKLLRLLGDVVDLPRKTLEDHVAHLLRLLDRAQLRRQEDKTLGLRSLRDRGQQPGGGKAEDKPRRYSPHIPSLPAPSSQIAPSFNQPGSC
jgi:hypothetical protein